MFTVTSEAKGCLFTWAKQTIIMPTFLVNCSGGALNVDMAVNKKNEFLLFRIFVQWSQLNRITDNVINWLKGSNLSLLTSSKLIFHT